ncbi:MAG: META domain-containing protein [Odoribacter sp.]|nr:META domain-containing protein [Odoribacter sp.]
MMFVLLVALAGCKEKENPLTRLKGGEWQLKTIQVDGKVVENPSELPVLVFSDSTAVYGSAGCNRFFGEYIADAQGNMTIKPSGSTMMACPDMEFEDCYLQVLPQIKKFQISGQELTLEGESEKLQLVYIPVAAEEK